MIADKIITGFYLIEIEGAAIESLIVGDFGIEKIAIGSNSFSTDISASDKLATALNFLVNAPHLDLEGMREEIHYNPEFFPTLPKLILSEEQQQDLVDLEEATAEAASKEENQIGIVITKNFDKSGDFIEMKWNIIAPTFTITSKIGVDPSKYMQDKADDKINELGMFMSHEKIVASSTSGIKIH